MSPANVKSLTAKWIFTTAGNVSATPTMFDATVYFPDWSGNLYAVGAEDGKLLWSHSIMEYNGRAGSITRVSPAVHGNDLIFGDNLDDATSASPHPDGAHLIAVDRKTGVLRWITQVDSHPAAVITGSPVVYGDTAYVGVSSNEETLAVNPAYKCCTFRGSMVAVNLRTGAVIWKTYMVPPNNGGPGGYSGNAIWQPPAIDPGRGVLYVGAGNNYSVPDSVEACELMTGGNGNLNCIQADDLFDSALALDLRTGAIKWSKRLFPYDAWTVACLISTAHPNCPKPAGPDYDLGGSGPNLLPNLVGFGQKSGVYWGLSPDNGRVLWSTRVGPGGAGGGIEWGTATDGSRIYVAIANSNHTSYTLADGSTNTGGSWSALSPADGHIIWQIADPTPGVGDPGAVSVANGVLYAGSISGFMYGIRADSGTVLFSFSSGGSVIDGPSIANGRIYWGSGYPKAPGLPNNKVYAFSLPGH